MPITRTPIVDDATGQTGTLIENAWKQQFYDQIDALTAGMTAPVYGAFTLIDHYGLAFPSAGGVYAKIGRIVVVQCQIVFPVTSNGNNVWIEGLPFAVGGPSGAGLETGYGIKRVWWIQTGTTNIYAYHPTTGVNSPYVNFSGSTIMLSGSYLTA